MVLVELDSYMQQNETQSPTYTIHKNKFKVDKILKYTSDTIKVLEENLGRKILDIPCYNIFTNMCPKARDINERIKKRNLIKIKRFCTSKENNIKVERKTTVWENILANVTLDKGLISKIYKELI